MNSLTYTRIRVRCPGCGKKQRITLSNSPYRDHSTLCSYCGHGPLGEWHEVPPGKIRRGVSWGFKKTRGTSWAALRLLFLVATFPVWGSYKGARLAVSLPWVYRNWAIRRHREWMAAVHGRRPVEVPKHDSNRPLTMGELAKFFESIRVERDSNPVKYPHPKNEREERFFGRQERGPQPSKTGFRDEARFGAKTPSQPAGSRGFVEEEEDDGYFGYQS